MSPDSLLESLKRQSNTRKQFSLDIVYNVCKDQYERGSNDFSIATIGKYSAEQGGPAVQSIRNKSGEHFRLLIKTWADNAGGSTKKPARLELTQLSAAMEKVEDPAARAMIGMLMADRKTLKSENDLLKKSVNIVIDRRILSVTSKPEDPNEEQACQSLLSAIEIEALLHAVSDKILEAEGWIAENNGSMVNEKGRVIFKPGYLTAIQKVLSKCKREVMTS